jgi:hypothetical protein
MIEEIVLDKYYDVLDSSHNVNEELSHQDALTV